MATETYNRLPSGLMARPANSGSSSPDAGLSIQSEPPSSNGSMLPIVLSIIALLLGASALYITLNNAQSTGISAADRAVLGGIANDLRSLQQKQFTAASPDLQTTVSVEKSFPLSDIMPQNFAIPISMDIPVQGNVIATSGTGQAVSLHLNDTLHVRTSVPIDLTNSTSGIMVNINKDVPITTRIRSSFTFSMVFGDELNSIIQKLDELSTEPAKK